MRNAGLAVLMLVASATGAWAQQMTIAALGDSLTQGYGLPPQDGLVPQLQEWLQTQGQDVTELNAGVSGDTTAGGLSRIDWTLTPDVDALIVALGGNDLLRGIDPKSSRANLDGILARAQDVPVLLVGMQAPGNFGPQFKADFDSMYPELAAEHDAILVESFFEGFGVEGQGIAAAGDLMQADGIHPNAQGVALIVEALGPRVMDLISRIE